MNNLIELIKSLNKSEKRYFQLHSKLQEGDKKYLDLFHLIQDLEHPTDEILEKKFKNKASFYHHKKYLYKQVINSLRVYHSKDLKARCNAFLEELEILKNKNLYEALGKRINVAKKLGEEYEQFEFLIALCRYEHTYYQSVENKNTIRNIAFIQKQMQLYLEQMQMISSIRLLDIELGAMLREWRFARTAEQKKIISKIQKNPLLKDDKITQSKTAEVAALCCKIIIAKLKNDGEAIKKWAEEMTELFEQNPFLLSLDLRTYLNGLVAICIYLSNHKLYDPMPVIFEKITKHYGKSLELDLFIFKKITPFQLNYLDQKNDKNEFMKFLSSINKKIEELKNSMDDQALLVNYTNAVLYYYRYEEKEKALDYINAALSLNSKNLRKDLFNLLSLLELILLYDLKKQVELEQKANTIYRKLYRNKMNFKQELTVIHFFKTTPFEVLSKKELKTKLLDFKEKILSVTPENNDKVGFFHYIKMDTWVDDKILEL